MNEMMNILPSRCIPLDDLLGGGVESGIITKLYGEGGSGKTNFCLQMARESILSEYPVAYIDTENVSMERFRQICTGYDYEEMLKKLLLFRPHSFVEQENIVHDVVNRDDVRLIIVDTLNMFYRLTLEDDKEGTMRSFLRQMSDLQIAARKKNLFVLVVEQVYTDKNSEVRPFTHRETEHMVKTTMKLERHGPGLRQAILMKHRSQPEDKKAMFHITAQGLE